MEIKVEDNIPIPDDYVPPLQRGKYPFASMKNGNSFFAIGVKRETLLQSAKTWKSKLPKDRYAATTYTIIQRVEIIQGKEEEGSRLWMHIDTKKNGNP